MKNNLLETKVDVRGNISYLVNGTLHSIEDKPALVKADGTKEWYHRGKLHRENGNPAVVKSNGRQEWWINGKLSRTSK